MISPRTISLLLVGVALLGLTGCDPSSPTSLERAAAALEHTVASSTAAAHASAVSVPITLRLATRWVVPGASAADCPDLIDPATGHTFMAIGTGEGQANHLGRSRFRGEHPTINLCPILADGSPTVADLSREGRFELVAADGSALAGRYEFALIPPDVGGFMTMTVEDGTRRFQGATGQLDIVWERSGGLDCPDIICLGESTLDAVFEGSLTLPRPPVGLRP
jgi:hypothetical protein